MKEFDIVHLVRLFEPNIGGMELVVREIVEEQKRRNSSVHVLTSDYSRNGEQTVSSDEVTYLRSFNVKGVILPAQVIRIRCATLHIHGMDPFVDFVSSFIRYDRIILSPHGGYFHTNQFSSIKRIYKLYSQLRFRRTHSYCISLNDMELLKGLGFQYVNYMGCGYKSRGVSADLESKKAIVFGRIARNKRVDISIKVALHNGIDRIDIIGHDEIHLSRSYNSEKIRFLGSLSDRDLALKIGESKFFICMSEYEGLGMSLVEALDSGLRCIVSDIPSFRHIQTTLHDCESLDKFLLILTNENDYLNDWLGLSVSSDEMSKLKEAVKSSFNWKNVADALTV